MTPLLPSSAPDPDTSKRVLDTLEFWAKAAGALGAIGVFVAKILKPYLDWRRKSLAKTLREVLAEELAKIDGLSAREPQLNEKLDRVLTRQDELFHDVDLFLTVAQDNQDRLDAFDEWLTAAGVNSDRRSEEDRRSINAVFDQLQERRKHRRRRDDITRESPGKEGTS